MERLGVASNVGLLFVLCDAAFVVASLQAARVPWGVAYQVGMAVPAAAAVGLLALSQILPDLFPDRSLRTPQQWTLPVAYGALCFLAGLLILQLGTGSSLAGPTRQLTAAGLWMSPQLLIGSGLVHIVLLFLALKVTRR